MDEKAESPSSPTVLLQIDGDGPSRRVSTGSFPERGVPDKGTCRSCVVLNFTWEHFLVTNMERRDALRYEANLIAHRISPEDTLIEHMDLITEVGQIAVGDAIKLVRAIKRQEDAMIASRREAARVRDVLGLAKYSPIEAQIILNFASVRSDVIDVERGREEWEESRWELDRLAAIGHIRSGLGERAKLSDRLRQRGSSGSENE